VISIKYNESNRIFQQNPLDIYNQIQKHHESNLL
jgi:hypothetical protein